MAGPRQYHFTTTDETGDLLEALAKRLGLPMSSLVSAMLSTAAPQLAASLVTASPEQVAQLVAYLDAPKPNGGAHRAA